MAGALNATFFAFSKRERSGVLLMATLAYIGVAAIMAVAFWFLNKQGIADYFNWAMSLSQNAALQKPGVPPSLETMMPPASVMGLAPSYLLFTFLYYLLFAAYEAACLRWMVRGETGGLLGLSLGADTWRVYAGYWLWFFFLVAGYIGVILVALVIGAVGGIAGGEEAAGATALLIFLGVIAALIGWLYAAVRFAPAAATSIARRRFAFFDAWKVSKGRFWALLGAFVLLILAYIVASIVGGGIIAGLIGANMFTQFGNAEPGAVSPDQVFAQLLAPQTLVPILALYAGLIVVAMFVMLGFFGVNARAAQAALEEGKIAAA